MRDLRLAKRCEFCYLTMRNEYNVRSLFSYFYVALPSFKLFPPKLTVVFHKILSFFLKFCLANIHNASVKAAARFTAYATYS